MVLPFFRLCFSGQGSVGYEDGWLFSVALKHGFQSANIKEIIDL